MARSRVSLNSVLVSCIPCTVFHRLEEHLNSSISSVRDLQKVRIFDLIRSNVSVTRKQIAERYSIRPSTVSDLVQQLIEDGFVTERTVANNGMQGRPQIALYPYNNRLVAVALYFVSMNLKAALINMAGEVLCERQVALASNTGHNQFIEVAGRIVNDLIQEKPENSELVGCGISFPGYVNLESQTWVFAARWPHMRNFRVAYIQPRIPVPVHTTQALDAELEHLLELRPHYRIGGTALVHWGYGIGSSYAYNGSILLPKVGSFGEIGHVVLPADTSELCVCGRRGCIETRAAIWAILPKLVGDHPELRYDERDFAQQLKTHNLERHPVIIEAIDAFSDALVLLYTILSPDRILLYGPFIDHPPIFSLLKERLGLKIPDMFSRLLTIEYLEQELANDSLGATAGFFRNTLSTRLRARS